MISLSSSKKIFDIAHHFATKALRPANKYISLIHFFPIPQITSLLSNQKWNVEEK